MRPIDIAAVLVSSNKQLEKHDNANEIRMVEYGPKYKQTEAPKIQTHSHTFARGTINYLATGATISLMGWWWLCGHHTKIYYFAGFVQEWSGELIVQIKHIVEHLRSQAMMKPRNESGSGLGAETGTWRSTNDDDDVLARICGMFLINSIFKKELNRLQCFVLFLVYFQATCFVNWKIISKCGWKNLFFLLLFVFTYSKLGDLISRSYSLSLFWDPIVDLLHLLTVIRVPRDLAWHLKRRDAQSNCQIAERDSFLEIKHLPKCCCNKVKQTGKKRLHSA